MVLPLQDLSPMCYTSAKSGVKSNTLQINIALKTKTFSAILKILKIRDSKPGVRGEFTLKPDEMNDLTAMNAIVSINREIHLYHGRANAIRPYKNGILSSVKSNNP